MPTIADIVNAKNTALNAIADAIHIIDEEKNKPGTNRRRLNQCRKRLEDEREAIITAADNALLHLHEVRAADATLGEVSGEMKETADELPGATKKVETAEK